MALTRSWRSSVRGGRRYDEHPALTYSYYSYFSGVPMRRRRDLAASRPRLRQLPYQRRPHLRRDSGAGCRIPRLSFRHRGELLPRAWMTCPSWRRRRSRGRPGGAVVRHRGPGATSSAHPADRAGRLVGDAGFHERPNPGAGNSDAFRDAGTASPMPSTPASQVERRSRPGASATEQQRNVAALPGDDRTRRSLVPAAPTPTTLARTRQNPRRTANRRPDPSHDAPSSRSA